MINPCGVNIIDVVIGEGANSFGFFLTPNFSGCIPTDCAPSWQIDAKSQTAILLLQTIDAPSPDCLPFPEPFELDTHTSGSNAP
jgi:hypothetical protein